MTIAPEWHAYYDLLTKSRVPVDLAIKHPRQTWDVVAVKIDFPYPVSIPNSRGSFYGGRIGCSLNHD